MNKTLLFSLVFVIVLSVDVFSQSVTANLQYTAGDTVCFTLVARTPTGDTIKNWNSTGSTAYLIVHNSTAATDTSSRSWNDDPFGFTFVKLTNAMSTPVFSPPNRFTINAGVFVDGVAEFCLIHAKADSGVYYEISPGNSPLYTISAQMDFHPGPVSNFFVDITSALPGQDVVFLNRKFELLVAPRDRFLNIINEEVGMFFSARWPGEFVEGEGLAKLFGGKQFISGLTNMFLASSTTHIFPDPNLQWIRAYMDDNDATGVSDRFEVIDHKPTNFFLYNPADETRWVLTKGSMHPRVFDWGHSTDPYANILISRTSNEIGTDVITYKIMFLDSTSLTRKVEFESDELGALARFSANDQTLISVVDFIAGGSTAYQSLMWLVESTDGLYTTRNTSPDPARRLPGFHLKIAIIDSTTKVESLPSAATGIALHQNYPNPVASGTVANIRFETTAYGPVTIKVYDMLGSEAATLADETLAPGSYNANFSATGLAPGVYHYTLTAGGKATTRSMVITK